MIDLVIFDSSHKASNNVAILIIFKILNTGIPIFFEELKNIEHLGILIIFIELKNNIEHLDILIIFKELMNIEHISILKFLKSSRIFNT